MGKVGVVDEICLLKEKGIWGRGGGHHVRLLEAAREDLPTWDPRKQETSDLPTRECKASPPMTPAFWNLIS